MKASLTVIGMIALTVSAGCGKSGAVEPAQQESRRPAERPVQSSPQAAPDGSAESSKPHLAPEPASGSIEDPRQTNETDTAVTQLPKGKYTLGEPFSFQQKDASGKVIKALYHGDREDFGLLVFRFVHFGDDLETPAYIMVERPTSAAAREYVLSSTKPPVLTAVRDGKQTPILLGKDMDPVAFEAGYCLPRGLKWRKLHNGFVIE